jgi:hypothetical protein
MDAERGHVTYARWLRLHPAAERRIVAQGVYRCLDPAFKGDALVLLVP